MPKAQITKEQILESALQMVIAQGCDAVNIKSVAQKLGCSTQPISWTFGHMENFRNELWVYALKYVNEKMTARGENPIDAYGKVGSVFIDLAYDAPNLILFLQRDEKRLKAAGGFGGSFDEDARKVRRDELVKQYGCTQEQAERFFRDIMIYTQGVVSMIIIGGLEVKRETAYQMLVDMSASLIRSFLCRE